METADKLLLCVCHFRVIAFSPAAISCETAPPPLRLAPPCGLPWFQCHRMAACADSARLEQRSRGVGRVPSGDIAHGGAGGRPHRFTSPLPGGYSRFVVKRFCQGLRVFQMRSPCQVDLDAAIRTHPPGAVLTQTTEFRIFTDFRSYNSPVSRSFHEAAASIGSAGKRLPFAGFVHWEHLWISTRKPCRYLTKY